VQWTLIDPLPELDAAALTAANSFLAALPASATAVSLPTSVFPGGFVYNLRATVRNWLGGSSVRSLTVTKAAIALPQLQLQGAQGTAAGAVATTFKTRSFTAATIYGPPLPCGGGTSSAQFSMQLLWTQISTVEQLAALASDDPDLYAEIISSLNLPLQDIIASLGSSISSGLLPSALTSPVLSIPPDTFTVGKIYLFVVQVRATRVSNTGASSGLHPQQLQSPMHVSMMRHVAPHLHSLLQHTRWMRRAPLRASSGAHVQSDTAAAVLPTSVRRAYSAIRVAARPPWL